MGIETLLAGAGFVVILAAVLFALVSVLIRGVR